MTVNNKNGYVSEIEKLKQTNDIIVLAHYYQPLEIQNIADFVGDSFDLSLKAKNAKEQTIVFCGVIFMAETAKILSPQKTVLIPDNDAVCSMARMIDKKHVLTLKQQYPDAEVMAYVNTTAEVKALSDVCVTSSTAHKIVNKLAADTIIFVPDMNLGDYVRRFTKKQILTPEGCCYVHNTFLPEHIITVRQKYPGIKVLVHPESPPKVIDLADEAASTSGMITYVANSQSEIFFIGTENGLVERLRRDFPEKQFITPEPPHICRDMKKIEIKDVLRTMQYKEYEIILPEDTIKRAQIALQRMIEYT